MFLAIYEQLKLCFWQFMSTKNVVLKFMCNYSDVYGAKANLIYN